MKNRKRRRWRRFSVGKRCCLSTPDWQKFGWTWQHQGSSLFQTSSILTSYQLDTWNESSGFCKCSLRSDRLFTLKLKRSFFRTQRLLGNDSLVWRGAEEVVSSVHHRHGQSAGRRARKVKDDHREERLRLRQVRSFTYCFFPSVNRIQTFSWPSRGDIFFPHF